MPTVLPHIKKSTRVCVLRKFLHRIQIFAAPFTVITFPFLFAVMFGDVGLANTYILLFPFTLSLGHGFLMALAAYFVIRYETPLKAFKAGGEVGI